MRERYFRDGHQFIARGADGDTRACVDQKFSFAYGGSYADFGSTDAQTFPGKTVAGLFILRPFMNVFTERSRKFMYLRNAIRNAQLFVWNNGISALRTNCAGHDLQSVMRVLQCFLRFTGALNTFKYKGRNPLLNRTEGDGDAVHHHAIEWRQIVIGIEILSQCAMQCHFNAYRFRLEL